MGICPRFRGFSLPGRLLWAYLVPNPPNGSVYPVGSPGNQPPTEEVAPKAIPVWVARLSLQRTQKQKVTQPFHLICLPVCLSGQPREPHFINQDPLCEASAPTGIIPTKLRTSPPVVFFLPPPAGNPPGRLAGQVRHMFTDRRRGSDRSCGSASWSTRRLKDGGVLGSGLTSFKI